ncbi:unnamed protein product [Mesocestoides corti]|uniref:ATP-grasp target RiPP n=1 Tax=Mesocestoides corti TaxID=53468 RepID=A0A0R3U6S1_MESCO|nr:unnamed protein product [Mesocestoides corti]
MTDQFKTTGVIFNDGAMRHINRGSGCHLFMTQNDPRPPPAPTNPRPDTMHLEAQQAEHRVPLWFRSEERPPTGKTQDQLTTGTQGPAKLITAEDGWHIKQDLY